MGVIFGEKSLAGKKRIIKLGQILVLSFDNGRGFGQMVYKVLGRVIL